MAYGTPDPFGGLKLLLILIALCLIFTGAALGLFYAHLVYQVFNNPEEVGLMVYVKDLIAQNNLGQDLLSGDIDGHPVRLEISNTGIMFVTIMIGLIGLQIFAMVARTLIEGGAAIFRIFLHKQDKKNN